MAIVPGQPMDGRFNAYGIALALRRQLRRPCQAARLPLHVGVVAILVRRVRLIGDLVAGPGAFHVVAARLGDEVDQVSRAE